MIHLACQRAGHYAVFGWVFEIDLAFRVSYTRLLRLSLLSDLFLYRLGYCVHADDDRGDDGGAGAPFLWML